MKFKNMRFLTFLPGFLAAAALFFLFQACSKKDGLAHDESCNQNFEKLHEKFEKEKYTAVRQPLSDLISTCTGSGFIEQAVFELAESHFHLKEWIEAQAEYSSLVRDFPESKYREQASFKAAICAHKQIHTIDRDQQPTLEAIEHFKNFINSYPASSLSDSARGHLEKLQTQLAQKDLKIAKLYLKMGEPQAAAIYYKSVLKEYENVVDLKALNLDLTLCYIYLNQFDEADSYLKKFEEVGPEDSFYPEVQKVARKLEKQKQKYSKRKKAK